MKSFRSICCVMTLHIFLLMLVQHVLAEEQLQPQSPTKKIGLKGKLANANGKAIPNATVTIKIDKTIRKAISNKEGLFEFRAVSPGLADITFDGHGYIPLQEQGLQLTEKTDLSRTLRSNWWSGWASLVLLIPGVLGLLLASVKEEWIKRKKDKLTNSSVKKAAESSQSAPLDNRFWVALFNGMIWVGSLALLARLTEPDSRKISLFHQELTFDFYVPILGFIGALLYVLDLCRRGREDIPRGTEFGMRMIMGPYVAIVMVVLFGNNLQFVDLDSPVAQGTVAFFSGLLVVIALQGLIERGNEWLGRWRRKSRYEPSGVAKKFGLSEEEDLRLRKADIIHLAQLREREEQDLRRDVRNAGFDENLAVDLRKRLVQQQKLKELVGDLILAKLEDIGVETIKDFSHLTDDPLEKIVSIKPSVDLEGLKALRDKAKKLGSP